MAPPPRLGGALTQSIPIASLKGAKLTLHA
jgi:hypothetical protein